ncbi:hypothetical protein KXV37_006723 [Aspergillus fumigatus]|nr:hypothetical protein KXV90_008361 [Aspergillus fumigatus]KAH2226381.1 hypothetical protein KXV37_006723 [Aspergillus fumigatus]KAH3168104.1 hypothetical protein KXW84_004518 [Aspergillus fumigatus]KAH3337639.1 hypothetical protein KXW81_000550 [Aspergillus fumigatus]KMK57477.1 hypothetical protein Y699_07018 [Aspergillus fumigatus Z5]
MNREIPGFYYDPDKKKYFKIQASHKAPAGAQYSKDAVKRKRVEHEVKRQRKVQLTRRLAKEKIRRSPFVRSPLLGVEREIGAQPISKPLRQEQQGLTYASQISRKQLHRFEPWPSDYTIKHVLRNNSSGILIASGHRGGESSVSVCFPDTDQEIWTYNRTMERVLFREPYRLSSISLSHTGYLLATMDSGPNGDSFLAPRMLPDLGEGGDYRWPAFFAHPIRIRTESSLWCSSPCPEGDKALFAIGTSDGLYTLEGLGSFWTLSRKPFANDVSNGKTNFHRRADSSHALVTSVEWLSSTVIAAGLKDSTVFLHDLRSGGTATRLQHPHAITKIRNLDSYRIVVAGINSLQMYDIRYAPNGLQHNPRPNHPRHTSTRPYLSFFDYSPEVIPDFDISPELGLLASASDERKVQLFSLRTGEQVSSPLTKYQYANPISSLRFESGDGSPHGPLTPTLLVCSSATVDEWVW